jgi:hypothetical protein
VTVPPSALIIAHFSFVAAERKISAMVSGCPDLTYKEYAKLEEAKESITAFMKSHFPN